MSRLKMQMAAAMVLAAGAGMSATALPRELAPAPSPQGDYPRRSAGRYYGDTHQPAARRAKKKIKKASQKRNRK